MKPEASLFNFTPNERKEYESSTLRFIAAAHVQNYLDHAQLQAKDLAQRMRKSRAWVSRLLSGRQNATLETLAEVGWALGARWKIDLVPAERAGTPAEGDPPPPQWAFSSTATIVGTNSGITNLGWAGGSPSYYELNASQIIGVPSGLSLYGYGFFPIPQHGVGATKIFSGPGPGSATAYLQYSEAAK